MEEGCSYIHVHMIEIGNFGHPVELEHICYSPYNISVFYQNIYIFFQFDMNACNICIIKEVYRLTNCE